MYVKLRSGEGASYTKADKKLHILRRWKNAIGSIDFGSMHQEPLKLVEMQGNRISRLNNKLKIKNMGKINLGKNLKWRTQATPSWNESNEIRSDWAHWKSTLADRFPILASRAQKEIEKK